MRNLVVKAIGNVIDVSVTEVANIMELLTPLAILIEDKVKFVDTDGRGYAHLAIEWEVTVNADTTKIGHIWECQAAMTCLVNVDGKKISVPIHIIKFRIFEDGTLCWHGNKRERISPESESIKLMAEALSFGDILHPTWTDKKLHFKVNYFPVVKRLIL